MGLLRLECRHGPRRRCDRCSLCLIQKAVLSLTSARKLAVCRACVSQSRPTRVCVGWVCVSFSRVGLVCARVCVSQSRPTRVCVGCVCVSFSRILLLCVWLSVSDSFACVCCVFHSVISESCVCVCVCLSVSDSCVWCVCVIQSCPSLLCVCVCVAQSCLTLLHLCVWCVCRSVVSDSSDPRSPQAPLSLEFCGEEYWRGLSCPPPGDLPHPGIEPGSLSRIAGRFFTSLSQQGSPLSSEGQVSIVSRKY